MKLQSTYRQVQLDMEAGFSKTIWEFPKIREPDLGVLIIRILLSRVLYWGPLFSETSSIASEGKHLGLTEARNRLM